MRKSVFTTVLAAVFAFLAMTPAFAGSLDAPVGGDPTVSGGPGAMFTLEDVYQRLATGAAGTKRVGPFAEPGAGPAPTGHTLDQIMALAPALDNTNGATAGDVMSGKKFWGLTGGAWGLQPGTGDPNLVPENIQCGKTIFGVTGTYCSSGYTCISGSCLST